MSIPQNKKLIRLFNRDGELEADVETDSLATFLEFASDFRDANGFIQVNEGQGGAWDVHEPTAKQSRWLQEF